MIRNNVAQQGSKRLNKIGMQNSAFAASINSRFCSEHNILKGGNKMYFNNI